MADVVLSDHWEDLRPDDQADVREFVATTIRPEAATDAEVQHGFEVVAKHRGLDYRIAALPDGRLALIHLTYRLIKPPDPLYDEEVFDSFDALDRRASEWAQGK